MGSIRIGRPRVGEMIEDAPERRLAGLIPAVHTPFHPDHTLNLDAIPAYATYLKSVGVSAAFVNGTTGESMSLTEVERKQLAEAWLDIQDDDLPVVIHVGHTSQPVAVELARHAKAHGAFATSAMGPSFFRPDSVGALVDFIVPIAAAAPDIPFYYYHIPGMTGVDLPMEQLLEEGSARIPNLAGLKFSTSQMDMLQSCLNAQGGKFEILFGSDEMLMAAMMLGVTGAVGSTYNYAAPLYLEMIRKMSDGEVGEARRLQLRSVDIVKVIKQYGVIPSGKAIMEMLGVPCGPARPPLPQLSADDRAALEASMIEFGITRP